MDKQLRLFRVFVASPSDLSDERRALKDVVEKINSIYSKETDLRLELMGWEDTLPGIGRPQDLINADLDKADLFIGCLWQRWGSSSGSDGRTGFQEEFERSLARRNSTSCPEMWLFFKEINEAQRTDAGPQLQRVLFFRQEQIEAKQLLFRDFKDVQVWREQVSDLLHRHMLKLVRENPSTEAFAAPRATDIRVSGPEKPQRIDEDTEVVWNLASTLQRIAEEMRSGEAGKLGFISFGPQDALRLLLFAATRYKDLQPVDFGVHETNSLYVDRAALKLSLKEKLFIIRAVLLDNTLTKPGWYWLYHWKPFPKGWLMYFAVFEEDEETRDAAIALAAASRFSLFNKTSDRKTAINAILASSCARIRICGLKYLAGVCDRRGIALASSLLLDDSKEVRDQAERTLRIIGLKLGIDAEVKMSVERSDSFDDEMVAAMSDRLTELSIETLRLCLRHPSPALRTTAASQLLARNAITLELSDFLINDEARAVRQCGYLARAKFLADIPYNMQSQLAYEWDSNPGEAPTWKQADPEFVVLEFFKHRDVDSLWELVLRMDRDSHLALASLVERDFCGFEARIRTELKDDFSSAVAAARARPSLPASGPRTLIGWFSTDSVESALKNVRVAALRALAERPSASDRDLFIKHLSPNWADLSQSIACLRGLAATGKPEDRGRLPVFLEMTSHLEAAATRTYLALSPLLVSAVKELVVRPSATQAWVVVSFCLNAQDIDAWSALRPLLWSEDENIRRFVCYYATRSFDRRKLQAVLEHYLKQGRYFYNVVTLLDRALYAPAKVHVMYRKQEDVNFGRWSAMCTYQWPGLT